MDLEDFYGIYKRSNKVTIDSRNIEKGDIFFAFSGDNFNAATLAEKAVDMGAAAVIVEQKEFENPERNIFYKPSTLEFLQDLAKYHRRQLTIPVIGLTGSNGKTTTKELIGAVLSEKYQVQYTVGNLNNHIGVPLTLLSVRPKHEIAVIEMGANHQQEIALSCSIAEPDFGYITNFGKAHLEGFGGFEGVIKGKSELYDYLMSAGKMILINENDPIQIEKTSNYAKKITFGSDHSDYHFSPFSENNFVGLEFNNEKILSRLTGDYNFVNLCAAAALGLHFGVEPGKVKSAIQNYTPTNMRSQVVQKNGKTFVLDTYNANPSSMTVSLENFSKFLGSKTIIIGDMLELGDEGRAEHQDILALAKTLGFDRIITVGKNFKEINEKEAFADVAALSVYLKENPVQSENILLKGSRGIALEKIIDFL